MTDPNDPIEPSVGDEAEAAAREIARLRAENCALRALAQQSACAYGHRTPDGVCRLGYPGCACADDLIGWDFDRGPTLAADLRRSQAEVARLTAERDALRCRAPVVITMDADDLRSEINRLILEHLPTAVAPLEAERDAYRGFAVTVGAHLAPPDADDMIGQHLRPGDLADLAEQVALRIDTSDEMVAACVAERLTDARIAYDHVVAERDRLTQMLRCERGEWAPTGWAAVEFEVGGLGASRVQWRRRWRGPSGSRVAATAWRVAGAWRWQTSAFSPFAAGLAPTALEAIEAADAAIREATGD